MLNIALLGTGAMALKHAEVLSCHPEARLLKLCSTPRSATKAREFQSRFGFQGLCTDYREVLSDPQVDAVYICTPDDSHPEFTARALRAGKHVFCEKPLARDESGFALVREAKASSGRSLQVGMNCRYRSQYAHAREFAESHTLGNLRLLRGTYLLNKVAAAKSQDKAWWSQRPPDMYFFLHANGIHIIDLMRWFGGEVESVFARATAFELGGSFRADTFSSSLQFSSGAIGELLISSVAFQPRDISLEAWYDQGTILGNHVYHRDGDEISENEVQLPVTQEVLDLHLQFDDFLTAIAKGEEPLNNFQEAYANFALIRAIERSLDSGGAVVLE